MIIAINIGEMENLKKTLPVIKQMYVDLGATVTDIKVSTISDIEVICVEMKKNGQNLIIGIAAAAPGEIFQVAVYNPVTNQYDYNILTEGINIIKTAVKNGSNAVNT